MTTTIKCNKCSHQWNYKGKSIYYAQCSMCRTINKLGKRNEPIKPNVPSKPTTVVVESPFKPVKFDPMLIANSRKE